MKMKTNTTPTPKKETTQKTIRLIALLLLLTLTTNKVAWGQKTFTGTGNWSTGAWSPSIPVAGDNVIINGTVTLDITGTTTIGSLTINAGGTLNTSSNSLIVTGATTIANGGTFTDTVSGGVNTFNGTVTVASGGSFTAGNGGSNQFRFLGNITNFGTFDLDATPPATSSIWQLGNATSTITVTNESSSVMYFSRLLNGSGLIAGDVIIANPTNAGAGNIELHGNGIPGGSGNITIQANKRLTNDLGTSGTPAGKRLIASPRNSGGTGATFINKGIVEIRGAAGTTGCPSSCLNNEPIYDFSGLSNLVKFVNVSDVMAAPIYNDVVFEGTNALVGNIIIDRNLTINTSAVLAAGTNNINIKGNWRNNGGTFNSSPGVATVVFNGTGAQTITGNTTFNNLEMLNPAGVTLGVTPSNITLAGTLILTSGKMNLGANNLTIGNLGSITGADVNKYIVTGSTGALIKATIAPTSFIFPVGDAANYQPITIGNITTSAGVRFGGPSSGLVGVGSWRILSPSATSTITLNNPQGGTLTALSLIATYNTVTSVWIPSPGGTAFSAGNYTTPNYAFPSTAGVEVQFGIFTPATIFYSNPVTSGGNWNAPGSWSSSPTSFVLTTVPTASIFPATTDIRIQDGHTITVQNSNDIVTGADVDVQGGGVLRFNVSNAMSVDKIKSTGVSAIPATLGEKGRIIFNGFLGNIANGANNLFAGTAGTTIEYTGTTTTTMAVQQGFGSSIPPIYQNLIISGSGDKELTATTIVKGNLTISSGAILNPNVTAYDIVLGGNFTNLGGMLRPVGRVIFNGTNIQTITGNTTFNNLEINNSANVTLAGTTSDISVAGALTLANGKLITNANIITSTSTGTLTYTNGWIDTSGGGKLSRIIGVTPTDFPIGDNNNLRLVQMSSTVATSIATAGFVAGAPANAPANAINVFAGTWKLSSTNDATVAFTNAATASNVKIQRLTTTSTWAQEPTTFFTSIPVAYTSVNPIAIPTETTFALFEVGLPLEIPKTDIRFVPITINNASNKVTFSWQSVGATKYQVRLGTVTGNDIVWKTPVNEVITPAGNPAIIEFVNNNIEYDVITYYSVRAMGATPAQNSLWSSPVSIFVNSINNPATSLSNDIDKLIKISPNPSSGDFVVDFGGVNMAKSVVRVHNAQGKQVFISENNVNNGNNQMAISLRNVANGIYLLQISTEKGNIFKKIVRE